MVVIGGDLAIVRERNQNQAPHQSDQLPRAGPLELELKLNVSVAWLPEVLSLFEASRVNEAYYLKVKLAICQQRSLAVVFREGDELESSLEIEHVEIGQGDATETV